MKLPLILLLSLLLFLGQWAAAEDFNNIAISGTVHNPKSSNIRVVLYSYVPGENHMSSSADLDENNSFHFVSYIREPVFGHIFYGKERIPVYLEPGYDLRIEFNAEKFDESLIFNGVGDKNNSFLVSRDRQFPFSQPQLKEKIRKNSEQEYIRWTTEQRQAQHELLEASRAELGSSFVQFQEADIDYRWANEQFAYGRYYEEHPNRGELSEDFYDFMDEVQLHQYEMILLQSYRDFLENYLQYNYSLMAEELSGEGKHFYSNMYQVARRSLRSLPMYHMQAVYLVKALNYIGVDEVTDEYIEFANECPKQAYKNVLHQLVKAQTVAPKEPDVVFTDERGRSIPLKELNGNIVLLRFNNYYSDSASKVLREHDKELKNKLASYKDVKFLELSMDDNQEAFEKMIYADATEYLKSIMNRPKPGEAKAKRPPFSYILLNREGLVVSNSLDDPTNELAIEKIDALLRQEKRSAAAE